MARARETKMGSYCCAAPKPSATQRARHSRAIVTLRIVPGKAFSSP